MPNFEPERRIETWQIRRRLEQIKESIFSERRPMDSIEHAVTGPGRYPERAPESGWKKFAVGDRWGGLDNATWFRLRVRVPKEMAGQKVVGLVRPHGESLVYRDGQPYQGLDEHHDLVFLTDKALGGETFELLLESNPHARFDEYHHFAYADIAVMHPLVWDFYWDCQVVYEVLEVLPPNYQPTLRLWELLKQAVFAVDLQRAGEPYHESIARAQKLLRKGLKKFETSYGMGRIALTGHSHIDTAWLWPLRETERKVGRTYSTVLRLMERYPEYHFSASQPVLYEYVKKNFPELWEGIRRRVKEGRWEPCGGPWVEPDCNVPSGESLVRQFVYGNRFFRKEFGVHSRIAWLPDAFGYPWSLPQILKKAQIDTFITTKISWSTHTEFPHSFFQWQGADGTRVWALMPPLNYNGNPTPKNILEQWNLFKQKDKVDEVPFSFGWGDGGGGPTVEMLEYGKRLKNVVGMPQCEFGRTQDSVDRMQAQVKLEELPLWNGELYLELHRGCQTTQARTKRNNRKCEWLLHDAEFLSSLALLHGGAYEQDALLEAWKIVLTNQFHDILPGSSINEVYKVADADYARAKEIVTGVRDRALAFLAKRIDASGPGTPIVVFNTLPWVRSDLVRVKVEPSDGAFGVLDPSGNAVPYQMCGDELVFETYAVPPLGYAVYRIVPGERHPEPSGPLKATASGLENQYLRVRLDKKGRITSIFDKEAGREVLAPGALGNQLQFFDDRPFAHDAWDIDHNFEEIAWEAQAVSVEAGEAGPVWASVRVVSKTERSTIAQDIVLYANSSRIDFVTHADWHEKFTLLKAAFPVSVLSPRATYEIQYATIERPTHNNTAFDAARFEVAGHRWADLSEGDYGVSLLNDCKYGYDVKGNVLRLSLLRSPINPDPHADEGEHRFTYAIYPHEGDWRNGSIQQGFELNAPLLAHVADPSPGELPSLDSFASVDAENVVIDHVKKAEDSDAIVVRLYESCGQRGEVNLTFTHEPKSVVECDLMEENDQPVEHRAGNVRLYMTPYDLRTLKVRF
jgi:alpha-mannosidase